MRQYATAEQLAAYPGGDAVTGDVDLLLQQASVIVDGLLRGVVYDVDSDSLPTDTAVAEALQGATCAQAVLIFQLGGIGARDKQPQWSSVSLGSLSLSGATVAGVTADGWPIAYAAVLALRGADLATPTVVRIG